jgi:dihydroorotate dehydrogenase electron transfer subunit
LIGGGIGIAPMYYALKTFKSQFPARRASVYLGFSQEAYCVESFRNFADDVVVDVGGNITDQIIFSEDAMYYACGPDPMLRAAFVCMPKQNENLWVSLESHMACGVGACLGCAVRTANGMRRVCKDGPVFNASEVCV